MFFRRIYEYLEQIMVDVQQLNQKIDQVFAAIQTEVQQFKDAIQAKIPPEVDLTAEYNRLDEAIAAISGIVPDEVEPETTEEPTVAEPADETEAGYEESEESEESNLR
jgi:hypothetical protein